MVSPALPWLQRGGCRTLVRTPTRTTWQTGQQGHPPQPACRGAGMSATTAGRWLPHAPNERGPPLLPLECGEETAPIRLVDPASERPAPATAFTGSVRSCQCALVWKPGAITRTAADPKACGKDSNGAWVGGADEYQGYGIDCSGLVCNGAYRAGYNWSHTTSPQHSWRTNTTGLTNSWYTTAVAGGNLNALPGDIYDSPDVHVVSLTRPVRGNPGAHLADTIEAAGYPADGSPPEFRDEVRYHVYAIEGYLTPHGYVARTLNVH